MGFLRPNKSRWDGVNVLELVPDRLVGHRPSREDPETAELLVPRFRSGILGKLLQPRIKPERAHIRVKLDARGTLLWEAMADAPNIADLARLYHAAFPEDNEQATDRVWMFLTRLEAQGFLALRNPAAV